MLEIVFDRTNDVIFIVTTMALELAVHNKN
jgi:hypothetical protein